MTDDEAPWQPGDESADADVEWAFSGAHDIEFWVVREGQLVPAESADLERIAERERERSALPRLRTWERDQRHEHRPSVTSRIVSWCRGFSRRVRKARPAEQLAVESNHEGTSRGQQNAARR